jgi:cation:H+ antiporter
MVVALAVMGLVVLLIGSEVAVGAAGRVARRFGVSPWIIGLTLTSVGTSLPELATTVSAALAQRGDAGDEAAGFAFANILASNVFLLTALLGATAIAAPMVVDRANATRDGVALLGATVAVALMAGGGVIHRVEGGVLVVLFVAWVAWRVLGAGRHDAPDGDDPPAGLVVFGWPVPGPAWAVDLVLLATGIGLVVGGAHVLLEHGLQVAAQLGVSAALIGVASGVGTSLPELVVSVRAARSGASALSLGNVLGSGITNLGLCLGAAALGEPIVVVSTVARVDLPFAVAAAAVALLLLRDDDRLTRREGGALVVLFVLYLVVRLAAPTA